MELPRFTLTADIPRDDIAQIRADIDEAFAEITANTSSENVRYWAAKISKNIVRASFGLVMLEEGKFTRDIDLCAESFLKRHPEHTADIRMILVQASQPTEDSVVILQILKRVSLWLMPAADDWLQRYT